MTAEPGAVIDSATCGRGAVVVVVAAGAEVVVAAATVDATVSGSRGVVFLPPVRSPGTVGLTMPARVVVGAVVVVVDVVVVADVDLGRVVVAARVAGRVVADGLVVTVGKNGERDTVGLEPAPETIVESVGNIEEPPAAEEATAGDDPSEAGTGNVNGGIEAVTPLLALPTPVGRRVLPGRADVAGRTVVTTAEGVAAPAGAIGLLRRLTPKAPATTTTTAAVAAAVA